MFYQESAGRQMLSAWLTELLPLLRSENADSRLLDEISAAEILDLTYIQGAPFDSAFAAHAVYPVYVEQSERNAVPSAMSVTFPVSIDDEGNPRVTVAFRCARASELKIGQGGFPRVTNPRHVVPDALLTPTIEGTRYVLGEASGGRTRSLAGPLRLFQHSIEVEIDRPTGTFERRVTSLGSPVLYGSVDQQGGIGIVADSDGGLIGRDATSLGLRQFQTYLWSEAVSATVFFEVKWTRLSSSRLELTVTVRNETVEPLNPEAKDAFLTALFLPHVKIRVAGGIPDFPALQYAEAKQSYLALTEESDRLAEASRRLYGVCQSGCIATQVPADPSAVMLTTFGIFDTPREEPLPGPDLQSITVNPARFLEQFHDPSAVVGTWVHAQWDRVKAILISAAEAFHLTRLHQFQWEAIQANLEFVATEQYRPVSVVRAPTGAGKTIVFFVNAAVTALCGRERSTSILMFPTRLLNEDMFRRLTVFTARLRANLPNVNVTGGILMGTSDPLYRLLLEPEIDEAMHHYGQCPACGESPLTATQAGTRIVPRCARCGHLVDYMYHPREVPAYLPDIVIATPDKLMYEATAARYEHYGIGLFGAPVRRCDTCGRVCPEAAIRLKAAWERCAAFYRQPGNCAGTFRSPTGSKVIRYMGFDEVHSLYGETATYLSIFLANLAVMQAIFARRREIEIRYETATATIANEVELLEALTRRRFAAGEIRLIPAEGEMHEHFRVQVNTARHRVLVTLPTKVSSRDAFIRASLNAFLHMRGEGQDLVASLGQHTTRPTDWTFILGYLFKKQEGLDMRRALSDMYRNAFGADLRVDFLSGEAPKNQISRILQQALAGEIDLLLANLVISLGIDIHGLNHMVMLGVPRGFTEYVQTAGRTGRGRSPGHVQIILQPFYPRDAYLYRHFHAILSDVAGYYDVLPVRSTNLFCAGEIFGNVTKSLITALCMNATTPQWTNVRGVRAVLGPMNGRIQGAITRILCDDPTISNDVRTMVDARYQQLQDQLARQDGFLSDAMHNSEVPWLVYSLRGRTGSTVRLTCVDQLLLERLQSRPDPVAEAENGEQEVSAPDGD
jgi:hypothetical protein